MDCGLELQDSRSHVQGGTCMEDFAKIQFSTRPDSVWPEGLDTIIQETTKPNKLQNRQLKVPNCIQNAATGEPTRYRPMTKITSRWLLTLAWNCEAVHCKTVRGTSDLHYSHWCKHKTVRFRKQRSMRKSKARTHGSHFRKPSMWEVFITAWCTSQSVSKKLWKYQKPKPQWT